MKLTENQSQDKLQDAQSDDHLGGVDGRDDTEHHIENKSEYYENCRVDNLNIKPRKDLQVLYNVKYVVEQVKQEKCGQTDVADGVGGHNNAARQILLNFVVITPS